MKIVQGLGLALALAMGTAGCVQSADAEAGPPTTAVPNFGLPSPDAPTTLPAPEPFVATDASFSAVFPEGQEPERNTETIALLGWHVPVTAYAVWGDEDSDLDDENDWAIIVGYVDYSRIEGTDLVTTEALDGALDGAGASFNGTVTSRTPVELIGAVGLDGVVEGDGLTMHVRLVGVGDRMWMLESITEPGVEIDEHYQTLLQTFQVI
jgi:hypothetical protein